MPAVYGILWDYGRTEPTLSLRNATTAMRNYNTIIFMAKDCNLNIHSAVPVL